MNVSFFSTFIEGGAALPAIALFESLIGRTGFSGTFYYSRTITRSVEGGPFAKYFIKRDPRFETRSLLGRVLTGIKARRHHSRLTSFLEGRDSKYEQFSYANQFLKTPFSYFGSIPDIIHLHWIADWLDHTSFLNSIPDFVPIVWTLHDMQPMTGGCHYSWGCTQYLDICKACPQLGAYKQGALVSESWNLKASALRNKNIHVVADSHWIEQQARKSGLLRHARSFRTIHYGVDHSVFRPTRERVPRRSQFVVAFGAASITNERKGLRLLVEALKIVSAEFQNVTCIVFGNGALLDNEFPFPITNLGAVHDQEKLAAVYRNADVFVIPSLQEAFGQTSLEAMACGVPVIGFDVGGLRDTIKDNHTGLLAKPGDAEDLATKIKYLIKNPEETTGMGQAAYHFARENFGLEKQADQYFQLYTTLLNANEN